MSGLGVTEQPAPVRAGRLAPLVAYAEVVLVLAVVGALAGALWEAVWTPPSGVAYQHRFVLDGQGLTRDFAGTGLFVVIGVLAGLAVAVVLTLVLTVVPLRAVVLDEVWLVAALVVGGLAASYLMWQVGTLLGPSDAAHLARSAADYAPIPGDLRVHGVAAFGAFPAGALLGGVLVLLPGGRRGVAPESV